MNFSSADFFVPQVEFFCSVDKAGPVSDGPVRTFLSRLCAVGALTVTLMVPGQLGSSVVKVTPKRTVHATIQNEPLSPPSAVAQSTVAESIAQDLGPIYSEVQDHRGLARLLMATPKAESLDHLLD